MNSHAELNSFSQAIAVLKQATKRSYDRSINKDLSNQQWQGMFGRNVNNALHYFFTEAKLLIQQSSFSENDLDEILVPFTGIVDDIFEYALQNNRTSCAISNFPEEHNPSKNYMTETLLQAENNWEQFYQQVKDQLPTSNLC